MCSVRALDPQQPLGHPLPRYVFFFYTFSIVHFMEMNNWGTISLFCLGGYLSGKEPVDFMQSAILSLCTQVSHISISIRVNSRSMVAVML